MPTLGIVEVHWRPEATGDALLGALAAGGRFTPVPSMHADAIVDLPPGAAWLASSDTYPFQAFRLGSAWGLQLHPEAGPDTLRRWADAAAAPDALGVADRYAARAQELSAVGQSIAVGFAAVVRQSVMRSSASTIVYA